MGVPTGTVTFLFTDIEGSSRLWEASPDAMRDALARHDHLLRGAIEAHRGHIFSTGGDGFAAAFQRAGAGIGAAIDAQAALGAEEWPVGAPIRVRMGLHTGEVEERDGDYFGPAVNRAARLMALAHGGQVVCSHATAALVNHDSLRHLGAHRLKDITGTEVVFQVGGASFPPLRSVDAVPSNLPIVRGELIGRADDVTRLSTLVSSSVLVTLTGTGGVGKTRLALATAANLVAAFPDGCWLVELATVSDRDGVTNAVATSVGVPFRDLDSIVIWMGDRRMLVVLDNCEHLVA